MKHSVNEWLPYKDMMLQIAAEYKRKYAMVDIDDLQQEMYLWFVTHPRKFREWLVLDDRDKDKLIARSLRNQCLKYCEKEKARTVGYDLSDRYYYDASVIEAFLPSIITESYDMPAKIKDLGSTIKGSDVKDGMNWLALRSDIAKAYYKLSDLKQYVLAVRFANPDLEWSKVAEVLKTTPDGARMKVQRAITTMTQSLGGWKPFHDEDRTQEEVSGKDSVEANDE